jgi:hypothetical protein
MFDFVRLLPATISLNLTYHPRSNFNERITAENSIARLTHSAHCSAPCGKHFMGPSCVTWAIVRGRRQPMTYRIFRSAPGDRQ